MSRLGWVSESRREPGQNQIATLVNFLGSQAVQLSPGAAPPRGFDGIDRCASTIDLMSQFWGSADGITQVAIALQSIVFLISGFSFCRVRSGKRRCESGYRRPNAIVLETRNECPRTPALNPRN